MQFSAQDEAAKAKLAEAEKEVADIKAHVDAHDAQTKHLHDVLEERTTESHTANKPLKVRVPANLVCLVTHVSTPSQCDEIC